MSKKIKILIFTLIILLTNLLICYAGNNTTYKIIIEDDANLLTTTEKNMLYTDMEKLTKYGNIIFKSINNNPFNSTKIYASDYYHKMYGTQSGTLFLIDMDERNIYIFSDGENYKTITSEKAEIITDNIYKYATNKKYYNCAKEAFLQMETLFKGENIAEPMKYISNIIIAIMLSLLINFTIFKRATRNKTTRNEEIIKECEMYFKHSKPKIEKTGEHKEYSPIDTDSGGSSGGSSSSCGGGGRRRK